MEKELFRVRAEISLDAIRNNIKQIQSKLTPGTMSCAVIKTDAYGHGALKVAGAIEPLVDYFAVATAGEALELRKEGIEKPLLVLGYVHPDYAREVAENNIRLTVFDLETAKELSKRISDTGMNLKLHIKIDTGMNRIGFRLSESSIQDILKIKDLPGLEIEGMFTHCHSADVYEPRSAFDQINVFKDFCIAFAYRGLEIPVQHCANSAAAIRFRQAHMNMVRLGIAIYGLYPSQNVHHIRLEPAMSLKSHVVYVKNIYEGETVSYGATFKAEKDTVIATVPVGYGDGYMRSLSNKGYVLIHGKKAMITGRVCMDQFMVDVTDIPDVKQGDEVVLVGVQDGNSITMEEISELAGSFNYEFACDINKRVPRIYV